MKFLCEHCQFYTEGEMSEDTLLPPAIVCPKCGSEILELVTEPNDYDEEIQ